MKLRWFTLLSKKNVGTAMMQTAIQLEDGNNKIPDKKIGTEKRRILSLAKTLDGASLKNMATIIEKIRIIAAG
jgi:hypothetical protein